MFRILISIFALMAFAGCNGQRSTSEPARQTFSPPLQEVLQAAGIDPTALAKTLFGAKKSGSPQSAAPFGGYAKGCLAGGEQLPETGPTWQAMRLSRNRNWGHPMTVAYLKRLSAKAAAHPGVG